jgi:hypothetical protein
MDVDITKIEEAGFNRIAFFTSETNKNIRHYTSLQAKYRSMGFQWLLAAFAAIAFVMSVELPIPLHKLWLVFAIAIVASLGILQLWKADILAYGILISAFSVTDTDGKEISYTSAAMKNSIQAFLGHRHVVHTLFYFYYIIIFIFTAVCTNVLLFMIPLLMKTSYVVITIAVVLVFLRILYGSMRRKSSRLVKKTVENSMGGT